MHGKGAVASGGAEAVGRRLALEAERRFGRAWVAKTPTTHGDTELAGTLFDDPVRYDASVGRGDIERYGTAASASIGRAIETHRRRAVSMHERTEPGEQGIR